MFALVDGNNFYVSCERVFNPKLEGRAVVVLSNNDGCVISRSNEAKALGIKMAEPYFQHKDLYASNDVTAFSSNYTLYGDMSNRMMTILRNFTPDLEIYSIDEAFLNLEGINANMHDYGKIIRATILKNIGIPVGVGIGSTKTLAKVANKIAKKTEGVFVIDSEEVRVSSLKQTLIEDVWGIGRQYARKLQSMNIVTAYDFSRLDPNWVLHNMTVVGHRTWEELNGKPCIPIEAMFQPKKNIATTRSFGKRLNDIDRIAQAVATHSVRCAEKLRKQHSVANFVTVFIHNDPFSKTEKYFYQSITITLPVASNSNNDIVNAAICGLKKIFKPTIFYKKSGVIVSGISSDDFVQGNLFETVDNSRQKKISQLSDRINHRYGQDTLKLAVQGGNNDWKLRHDKLSPCYTTRWEELLKVNS